MPDEHFVWESDGGIIFSRISWRHSISVRLVIFYSLRPLFPFARRLTNSGHELLDTMRNESVWGKVKDTFKTKGVEMTFALVLSVGKKVAENLLFS
ncbi:MAG: DUF2513 domain-containing protein [Gammaproteobacteria bacterium]